MDRAVPLEKRGYTLAHARGESSDVALFITAGALVLVQMFKVTLTPWRAIRLLRMWALLGHDKAAATSMGVGRHVHMPGRCCPD